MITIDTHILIWDAINPERISAAAKRELEKEKNKSRIIVSEITLWEISMLISKKRLIIEISYLEFIKLVKLSNNYLFRGITPEIAYLSTSLSDAIGHDPADRIICATALETKTALITADKKLRNSNLIRTIW